jgi:hypothetical protein
MVTGRVIYQDYAESVILFPLEHSLVSEIILSEYPRSHTLSSCYLPVKLHTTYAILLTMTHPTFYLPLYAYVQYYFSDTKDTSGAILSSNVLLLLLLR